MVQKDGEVFEITVEDRDNPITLVQGHAKGELWALAIQPAFATGSDDKVLLFTEAAYIYKDIGL